MIRLADRLAPCWQCTSTFFPSFVRFSIVSQSVMRSGEISVLWSQGMWMYSGSLNDWAFGVVGVSPASSGKYSYAVAKLAAVAAVSGIGESSAGFSLISGVCWGLEAVLKGFKTSRATLITTSKRAASSAVGSRYR